MPFYTDIESQFKDLDVLSNYEIDYCLPAHGLPIRGAKNFKNALAENRKKLEFLEKMILDLIKDGKSEDQLKKEIAEKLSINYDFTKYIYVTITQKRFFTTFTIMEKLTLKLKMVYYYGKINRNLLSENYSYPLCINWEHLSFFSLSLCQFWVLMLLKLLLMTL
ncbi:MAG: hypothetical protein AMQ22_01943 [Candidatus Methanofastidiosum methylothiophilum]|uniref:Hydroxyacylglutathione hydrolase n=1 Tax=Candidatus Methanofastidiosum methylothiophilum TaxID=1705564 RepID=A0A150IRZ5_9EURY|nr:MAG: hypothetical protein AMQ22_01943 [Candidatus Methanofastidiosum methylthiophilus]